MAIIAGASGYMLFDVAMLGVCFAAFGNDVPPAGVLLVAYIIGQLGSLIPIPGGIGGVDAGLIGTLVLYGVDATDAAVAVIAYRGLLLAIPALLGLPALAVLRRRLRAETHDIAACAPGGSVEVLGRGTPWSGRPQPEHELVHVAPAPVLARLGRADDRMPARGVMGGGVAPRRVVAAADVAAGLAHAQVDPARALGQALLAARDGVGELEALDRVEMRAGGHQVMVPA